MPVHIIIFSLRVAHPKLDLPLPLSPGITFPSLRAALSPSLHLRTTTSLRNHSVPTSCSVRPAHGRPLSQSVCNKFLSISVLLPPSSSGLATSPAVSNPPSYSRVSTSSYFLFSIIPRCHPQSQFATKIRFGRALATASTKSAAAAATTTATTEQPVQNRHQAPSHIFDKTLRVNTSSFSLLVSETSTVSLSVPKTIT